MKLSIKEKAGIIDTSRIFNKLHLYDSFMENMADQKLKNEMDEELIKAAETHFEMCGECRRRFDELKKEPKNQNLPL